MKQKECIYKSVDTEERSSNDGDYPAIFKQTYSRTEWYRNMFHFREWESFLVPLFSRYLIYLVHILLFSCSVSLAAWALTHRSAPADSCPRCYVDDEQCTIHMSARSPIIDAGVVTSKWQELDGNPNSTSIYRGPPTYDREKAWDILESRRMFNLPKDYLQKLKKADLPNKIKTAPEAGGGYAAHLEVHHQLHCLASLRQWVYKDVYVAQMVELPETFHAPVEQVHKNLDFCIEMLRQTLMCNADTTPVLLVTDDSLPEGYSADLSIKRKCRDWDAIIAWEDANRVMP